MDSARGVYVVSIVDHYSKLKDFLRPNDVILEFAGKAINDLDELEKAIGQADYTKPLKLDIYRNQREKAIVIPVNTIRSQK